MSAGAHGKHRRLAGRVAIAWALLLCSVTARAQTPSGDREEERTALYRVGVAQADAGRWAEAVETFRKVIAIRSAPPALFTLGQAEQHLGRLVEADRTYHRALADAGSAGNQEVAGAAQRAIAALEPRVPRLVLHLAGAADGASATLDGAGISPGAGSDVDPGDHVVVVRATGARPFTRRVHVAEGQTLDVSAVLEPERSPPTEAPPAATQGSAFPLGPVVLAGAGVALGVAGYVVRAGGQSDYDSASAGCAGTQCPTQSQVDSGNSARTRMAIGTAMLGVGIAALAGGGLWWALTPSSTGGAQVAIGGRF